MKLSSGCLRFLSVLVSFLVLLMPVSFAQQFSQADVKAVGVNGDFLAELRESESVSLELWRLDSASVVFKTSSGVEWEFVPLSRDGPALYMVGPVESAVNLARVDELSGGVGALVDKPDLVTGEFIDVFPKNPTTEQLIEFIYTTLNSGDGEASPSVTKFYVDGDEKISCNVPSLKKNNYLQCGVKVSGIVIGAGSHVLKEVVDANSQVSESDEGNNVLSQNLVVRKLKFDLIVYDLLADPTNPDDESGFTIRWTVLNNGVDDIKEAFSGNLYVDGKKVATGNYDSGAHGGQMQALSYKVVLPAGHHSVSFFVDEENKIKDETDESNNRKEIGVDVSKVSHYDVGVAEIYTAPSELTDKTTFELRWAVENLGNVDIYPSDLESSITANGITKKCDLGGEKIEPEQRRTCTLPSQKWSAGSYSVKATVKFTNAELADENPDNDELTKTITVSASVPDKPVYDCNGVKKSCKDADAVGVCVGAVLKCCMKDYPHYWNLDDTCHASVEPVKCALPDGSGAGCDCDWNKDCPSSHPFCEQSYPAPISDGFDGCLAVVPEYCGNGVCAGSENFGTCETDCAAPLGVVDVYVNRLIVPVPGAKVLVDGILKGITDQNGRAMVEAPQGIRTVTIDCPDGNAVARRERSVLVKTRTFVTFETQCNLEADSDGDGYLDSDELLIGTDPKDKSSYFPENLVVSGLTGCLAEEAEFIFKWKDLAKDRESLIQSTNSILQALNTTSVTSASVTNNQKVILQAMKKAGIEVDIIENPGVTLRESASNAEYMNGMIVSDGVLLLASDYETGTTALKNVGASCAGIFIGIRYGQFQGVIDDVKGAVEGAAYLIQSMIEGIYESLTNPAGRMIQNINTAIKLAEATIDAFRTRDALRWKLVMSIFQHGSKVNIFREDWDYPNKEAYFKFQIAFYSGYVIGYASEQIATTIIPVTAIIKAFKSGKLLKIASNTLARLPKLSKYGIGVSEIKLLKGLPYISKIIEQLTDDQLKLLTKLNRIDSGWVKGLTETEALKVMQKYEEVTKTKKLLAETQLDNLLATHLGRETIKLSETTPELLAKQSKLVEKLGVDEVNKITKKSFFKAFDADRVDGLRNMLDAMPENLIDDFTLAQSVRLLGDKDVVKAIEKFLKSCSPAGAVSLDAGISAQTCLDIFIGLEKAEDFEDVGKGLKTIAPFIDDLSKLPLKGEELQKVMKHLGTISDVKGVDKLAKHIAAAEDTTSGFTFEAEMAAILKKRGGKLAEVSKEIAPKGVEKGEIDSLLKNGDIYEAKVRNWDKLPSGSKAYNDFKSELGQQIVKFIAFQKETGTVGGKITFMFKGSVEPGIEAWLKTEKNVLVEVLP